MRNPCRVSHVYGFASSGFARHYSRNHYCFLFLRVLRCFTSPRSLHAPYVFRCGSPGSSRPWRGFPIRTPWDHSPVIDSPRLIADSYVLLRLLMPRHPPCALKNLTTKDQGVIYERTTETTPSPQQHPKAPPQQQHRSRFIFLEIASYKRCSRPLCSSQTTTPYHTPHTSPHTRDQPHDRRSQETRNTSPGKEKPSRSCCLRTQQCAKHYPAVHSGVRSRTLSREHPY